MDLAVVIRPAALQDLTQITEIYRHAVMHGTASWEIEAPDFSEMHRRFEAITAAGYPYLVAEMGKGALAGYAYVSAYRPRSAYRWAVEDSIYIAPGAQRRGIGRIAARGSYPDYGKSRFSPDDRCHRG